MGRLARPQPASPKPEQIREEPDSCDKQCGREAKWIVYVSNTGLIKLCDVHFKEHELSFIEHGYEVTVCNS